MGKPHTYSLVQRNTTTVTTIRNGTDPVSNYDTHQPIQSVSCAGENKYIVTVKNGQGKFEAILFSVSNGQCAPQSRRTL